MSTMSTITAFIDSIDEDVARLVLGDEGDEVVAVPLYCLPKGSKPGEVLQLTFTKDPKQTLTAKGDIKKLDDELSCKG